MKQESRYFNDERYIIVEDMETKKLSVISNTEYRKENDKNIIPKYEAISDAETMEKAEAILAHIREVGGVQNYFTEIMIKCISIQLKQRNKQSFHLLKICQTDMLESNSLITAFTKSWMKELQSRETPLW